MPYDPNMVAPMREELSSLGVTELLTAEEVETWVGQDGPRFLIINSVCGCAAGQARPAIKLAMENGAQPASIATVFAGQDLEAVSTARSKFADYPPSSPSMVLMDKGEVLHFVPRHQIESRSANDIAADITGAFDKFCAQGDS